jgi:uncharacterized protein (TIGR02246 family)
MTTATEQPAVTTNPAALASTAVERLEQAWNEGDGAAFGALFADESDFVDIRGGHHRGDGTHIGRAHQELFDGIYAGSTVAFRLDVARLLAPGCILALATSTLDAPHGPLQGVNQSRMTMALAQEGGEWRIFAFHNTLIVGG